MEIKNHPSICPTLWQQRELMLRALPRGFHLITHEVQRALLSMPMVEVGLLHLFLCHTSASLTLNENADPTVRADCEAFFSQLCPEEESYYQHVYEGPDDMPAHLKSSLLGATLTIPLKEGALCLGTWQGIYLCEHRNQAPGRRLILTVQGSPVA